MSETVKLSGFNELENAMRQLGGKVARRAGIAGMKMALKPTLTEARRQIPERTGKLKKALKIRVGKTKKKSLAVVRVSLSENTANLFTGQTFYGGFQEFGWRSGPRRLGDSRKQNPGEHFMQNAWEETRGTVLNDFKGYLGQAIEKAAAKLANKK